MNATQMSMQTMVNITEQLPKPQSNTSKAENSTDRKSFDDLLKEKTTSQNNEQINSQTAQSKPTNDDESVQDEQVISAQASGFMAQINANSQNVQMVDLSNYTTNAQTLNFTDVNMQNTNGQNMQTQHQQGQNPAGEIAQGAMQNASETQQAQSANTDKVQISAKGINEQEVLADEETSLNNYMQTQLFKDVKSTPIKVAQPQTLDTTADAFDTNLYKAISEADLAGANKIILNLSPANLGNVTVEMSTTPEGVLNVVLIAETDAAARLINENSSKLGAMLLHTNAEQVKVEIMQVEQGEQSQYNRQDDPNRQSRGNDGRGNSQTQKQQETNEIDFMQKLRLGLEQAQYSSA